jgi:hypothetical protein
MLLSLMISWIGTRPYIFDKYDIVVQGVSAHLNSTHWRFRKAQGDCQIQCCENRKFEGQGSVTSVIRLDRISIGGMANQFQQVFIEAMHACAGLQAS